ncbi:MAG: histidine kinase [Burkholderiales bacterium]|nr:histidine kinase [Burkholderiales bacterium]
MSAFISLISGLFFWNQAKIAELQAEQEREKARSAAVERQALQAQLQRLQAQIEPHMLFNTLANLQGLIAIDPARAQYMLEQLIHYLRASLSSSRLDRTTLKHEFDLMQAYLELLAIRMGKRLQYHCDLPEELEQQGIAPMLIQPLVENAIKHGVEPKMEGGSVHVSAEKKDATLHIKIIDTGLGLSEHHDQAQAHAQHSHVGNANIRERLLALYGSAASLQLSPNHPEGCIAHLQIPLAE